MGGCTWKPSGNWLCVSPPTIAFVCMLYTLEDLVQVMEKVLFMDTCVSMEGLVSAYSVGVDNSQGALTDPMERLIPSVGNVVPHLPAVPAPLVCVSLSKCLPPSGSPPKACRMSWWCVLERLQFCNARPMLSQSLWSPGTRTGTSWALGMVLGPCRRGKG